VKRSLICRLIFGATVSERRRQHAKALDGRLPTPEQLRQLGGLIASALTEIRAHCDKPRVVFALADAFHNLPRVMFAPEFSWSWALIFFEGLEREQPEIGRRYIEAFDTIMGFRAAPGAAGRE
jgi:hypothetical protein